MSQRYAKLYAKAGENPDIGELLEDDPLAVALFFLAIARADVYGILPAEPRRFRSRVAPAAVLGSATVAQSLHNLETHGLVRRYTASDGTELLHILHYSDYQDVRWANRIGPPEYELPEWWEPPSGFIAYLTGLSLDKVRSRDNREKWSQLRDCYCSTTVALLENNPRQDTRHKTHTTDTPNTNDSNDLTPPAVADDVAAVEPEPEPPARKPRAETPEQQAIHRLWDAFELPGGPTPPKGVKPGYSSVLKQLTDNGIPLFDELSAHVAADPTARLPEGAAPWGWFCTQVRRYVAAPWKWQTEQSNQLAHAAKPFQLLNDGTRCYADDWNLTQQYYIGEWQREGVWDARTGCTTQPRTGACCTDGWYYANDDSGTLQQERRWAAT